jgi:hypothetical protein
MPPKCSEERARPVAGFHGAKITSAAGEQVRELQSRAPGAKGLDGEPGLLGSRTRQAQVPAPRHSPPWRIVDVIYEVFIFRRGGRFP